jgi:hypothetical protein
VPRLEGEKEIIDMNMVAIFGRTDHVLFGHTVLLPHLGADYFTAICTQAIWSQGASVLAWVRFFQQNF